MLLVILVALVAGAGTAITPCVVPVLPALLSASGLGGRRRPLGIVVGLAVTFFVSIVALASIVKGVGIGASAARDASIVILITFGVVLMVPALSQRVQAPLSRLARFGPKTRGDGFFTGLGVGAALGFVCTPCAGPILAGVISISDSHGGPTLDVALTGAAFSIGLSAVMLLYAYGGRWVLARIKTVARGNRVEVALGVVLIATGVALAFNLDVKLQSYFARHGGFFFDPTSSLEASVHANQHLVGASASSSAGGHIEKKCTSATVNEPIPTFVYLSGVTTPTLKCMGAAPSFTDNQDWFNTPDGKPLTLASLKGKVVLVDFWTYTCINCVRTLPFIEGLYRTYHKYGLEIVGVETPEFTFEQEASNVQQAIKSDGLTYPVVQDNDYGTWDAYHNEYWPADYLIDATGQIRHEQFGEGDYQKEEAAVRTLLYEAGDTTLPKPTTAKAVVPSQAIDTPETYLNPVRDEGFAQSIQSGTHSYSFNKTIKLDEWALTGSWNAVQPPEDTNDEGYIDPTSSGATISGGVQAKDVYLVMSTPDGKPATGRVLLDGKPIPAKYAGSAVSAGGYFTVTKDTLYNLVNLTQDAQFEITVELPKGVRAYDFTFG